MERLLAAIAEQALHHGAKVGLNALVKAVVGLTGTSGAAFHTQGRAVAVSGQEPPAPERAPHPWRCFRAGPGVLVLGEPCEDALLREHLARFVRLGHALSASLAREEAAREEQRRLRQERLRLKELVLAKDRAWSRAAHDLRTPLLVLQGYLEMIKKGMAGELNPAMTRYMDRMRQSAGDLNTRLQQRHRGEAAPAADARSLLRASFGAGRPNAARLELPDEAVHVRMPRVMLTPLIRAVDRLLTGAGTSEAVVSVDVPEDARFWRMRVRAQVVRPPLPRAQAALERFARRAEGEARVEMEEAGFELTVLLPRVAQ